MDSAVVKYILTNINDNTSWQTAAGAVACLLQESWRFGARLLHCRFGEGCRSVPVGSLSKSVELTDEMCVCGMAPRSV